RCLILPKASAASIDGTETRTMSAPAASRRWIWPTVASTSQVSVLVMLCTEIGASPPTGTLPTQILRDRRRLMGDSQCISGSLPQFEAGGLTVNEGGDVDSLAIDQHRSEERRVGKKCGA